jgi:hypothetical protein
VHLVRVYRVASSMSTLFWVKQGVSMVSCWTIYHYERSWATPSVYLPRIANVPISDQVPSVDMLSAARHRTISADATGSRLLREMVDVMVRVVLDGWYMMCCRDE